MEILLLLIPVSVLLVFAIGAAFWWSVSTGQFDDLEGPAHRILTDDDTSDVIPSTPPAGERSPGPAERIDLDQVRGNRAPVASVLSHAGPPDLRGGGVR